jgi:O-glycosyl hydrolase
VRIDASVAYQVMDGFGASHQPGVLDGRDVLSAALRSRALDAIYRQVGLSMGPLEGPVLESTGQDGRNDNDDPNVFNWAGFQTSRADALKTKILDRPEAAGFKDFFLFQRVNIKWASQWLKTMRAHEYRRYLDEVAEQVAAGQVYWRDKYGIVPRYQQPFNEPLSGNGELDGGGTQEVVDIIRSTGERLKREGFPDVRLVVPAEETEEKAFETASAILADSRARRYVGAISYHPYPYESAYANIPALLRTRGAGHVDAARVEARRRLRDLAARFHVPLWMTEVSHGAVDARSYDSFRGRAIHIHDELSYANASAYFGMYNMWDLVSHQAHYGSRDGFFQQEGSIALIENESEAVTITGIGHAIGHYARWIHRGAVRVTAEEGDPLLLANAFRDANSKRLVLVLINNAGTARKVTVNLRGARVEGEISGEQSTPAAYWSRLTPLTAAQPGAFTVDLPAVSVTTLAAPIAMAADRPGV